MFKNLPILTYILLLYACGLQQSAGAGQLKGSYVPLQSLAQFSEHGIDVRIQLERDQQGGLIIASTYAPQQPDIHLYSKDLPRNGIDGAGRPTLLELPEQTGVQAAGPVFANQPVHDDQLKGFRKPFPIYPDGPVTLRLPVALDSQAASIPIELRLTYMGCSSKGYCLPPVLNKQVLVVYTR